MDDGKEYACVCGLQVGEERLLDKREYGKLYSGVQMGRFRSDHNILKDKRGARTNQ